MRKNEEKKSNSHPVFFAIFTFLVLFGILFASLFFYDYSDLNMGVLSFILTTSCIVFFSKSVYEVISGQDKVKSMSETMANKLVKSSQQLFLEVYNNSPVSYLIVGKFGDIVSANTATARLLGLSVDSLVKKDLFNFIEVSSEEHKSILKQKFQQGVVVSDEEVKVHRGNTFAWTQLSMFQFSNSDGRRLSLVTFVDITKQKEIDTAKTEFVSLASHQLRTPISGMRWSAELLLMDGVETLSAQQKRYIDRLLSSIQRMSSLVDDFLQVSRFELGTRVIKQEEVILDELFDDIIAEQAEVAAGKSLVIGKEYDKTILHIYTDLGLLRMIVTNLYVNAVKYSRNTGQVTISYLRQGSEIVIEVKDNGMGIPLSEQSRVFSKIFRATNAAKEVPDGTGLGLYIVEKAVQSLRGRITFVSNENVGTTFTVVLPIN